MTRFIGILFTILIFIAGCSDTGVLSDGGSGTETTNSFTATAAYPDGSAADNATVSLRGIDYWADSSRTGAYSEQTSADTTTDQEGRFAISGIEKGNYTLEINDNAGKAVMINFSMQNDAEQINFGTITLKDAVTIHGTIHRANLPDSVQLDVLVRGLERKIPTDSTGSFTMENMPSGELQISFHAVNYEMDISDIHTLWLQSGVDTSINFGGLPVDFALDSIVLSDLLSRNTALVQFSLDDIATRNGNRITRLDLSGRFTGPDLSGIGKLTGLEELDLSYTMLAVLPPEIGTLTGLEILKLDNCVLSELPPELATCKNLQVLSVNNNYLQTLPPWIGELESLETLHASFNNIYEISPGIGGCIALKSLDLAHNALTDLPLELARLPNLDYINITNNRLCTLTPSMTAWVDSSSFGMQWEATQRCP
ncbi:MAG: hypothetical protein GF350_07615 [Chitinivibrionales bacterium]|nr:hypothetical protein [Chitinivibrionales bacterium]